MAVGGSDNPWWTDLLRHGRASRYAKFFDVDWECEDPALRGKVLAPFLGKAYGEALADGDIRVMQSPAGEPVVRYFDTELPISPADHAGVAEFGLESFHPANSVGQANIHSLLERQHYRLAWWGTAGDEINWRRFFDINGLAGLRIEVPEVLKKPTPHCSGSMPKVCSTVFASTMSTVCPIRPAIAGSCVGASMTWRRNAPPVRRRGEPIWWSRKSSARLRCCPRLAG